MPPRKRAEGPTPVESVAHADKRRNIPTADAKDFVSDRASQVEQVRYERDPSLDPQLVWKGKDAADGDDLVADAPPIYIQEKIDPRVLIENLRRTASSETDEPELTLFDDFDGLDPMDKVDFYSHAANWSNRMILGDSLQVMASLTEKEDLRGQVQMIYLDPPYGIKFGSNWQVSTRKRRQGRQARRRHPRGRADQGVPRHLGVGYPLLLVLPAGSPHGRPRAAHREREHLRPDRRRERSPRQEPAR